MSDTDARLARVVTALLSYPALAVVLVLTLLVRYWYGFPLLP